MKAPSSADLRLDYVSPLPPVRSGISDYSVDLLPALAELCELRLLRLPGQPVAAEVEERWRPLPAREALKEPAAPGKERVPLYQMGNNRHHEAVAVLAREMPGVLTLHDWVLHHLESEMTLGRGVWDPYRAALGRDHGLLGDLAAVPRRWGGYSDAALFSLPVHRDLLRRQRGVLVHNRWAAERLREEDPEIRVRVVPMGIPLPPEPDPEAAVAFRERFGLPASAPLIGSFGFQTPIKRTDAAIAALASPGLEDVHLVIVGQVSEHSDLEGAARRAGVAERVHVTGFVSFEEFEGAIAATDLCLNLRYPTAGETSASLLRVLAVGRPAIVSDHAQFAELPEEVAIRVPLGEDEVPVLARRLRSLLASPERLVEMGRAARRHVEREHDLAAAARAVVEACLLFRDLEPPGPDPLAGSADSLPRLEGVPRENDPPTTLTWSELPGTLEVRAADGRPVEDWPPGTRRRLSLSLANRSPARWLAGRSGPGGVAIQMELWDLESDRDLLAGRPWLALPRPLEPGQECVLEIEIRRPPGPARLRFEPHVLGGSGFGGAGFGRAGGPVWQREI